MISNGWLTTPYIVIANLEKAINRRWILIANISKRRVGFVVLAANDNLVVVNNSIEWPIMTYGHNILIMQ